MLTLFRLISVDSGTIYLDGVDTSKIGLDALRRQLSIIPQARSKEVVGKRAEGRWGHRVGVDWSKIGLDALRQQCSIIRWQA